MNRICELKEKFLNLVESQLEDVKNVDARELGEVMDMAKDCAELHKYCMEAEYYQKVTGAMDDADSDTKAYYIDKYNRRRLYHDDFYPDEKNRDMDKYLGRMYYTNPSDMIRDYREGKSPISRRIYMEHKDSPNKMTDFEKYVHDLGTDITEMISGLTPDEKALVKQKITELSTRIV